MLINNIKNMEIVKREENYRNPVKTAKINFLVIGVLYLILGFLFYTTNQRVGMVLFIVGIFVLVAAYLLNKQKMAGVYLGWLLVLVGILSSFIQFNFISLIIVAYIGYWNYKASVALKGKTI